MVAIFNQCQDLHTSQMTQITSVKLNSGALESDFWFPFSFYELF